MINLKAIRIQCDEELPKNKLANRRNLIAEILPLEGKLSIYFTYETIEEKTVIITKNEKERETDFQHENV